jgi:WD40 repeat protein
MAISPDGKTLLIGGEDSLARFWDAPQPIQGDPERIHLWAQVVTGLEIDELNYVRILDAAAWHDRRVRLAKLGGSADGMSHRA